MKEVEGSAIDAGRVSGLELMERAARAASEEIVRHLDGLSGSGKRVIVLCGPGNNGGDGYAIARNLKQRGWRASVWAVGDPVKLSPEATECRSRWLEVGDIHDLRTFSASDCVAGTVIVDAIFGTGLHRPLGKAVFEAMRTGSAFGPVVAVDVLSGVNSDTGEFMCEGNPDPVAAELTVSFQCAKPGHFLREGGVLTGKLAVRSIGLEQELDRYASVRQVSRRIGRVDISPGILTKSNPSGNKYDYGHLLVLSGGKGRGGAARLAARGAMRVGVGLVTIGVETGGMSEHASQLNAIMLKPVDDARSLSRILEDQRINCVCAGPNLGLTDESCRLVEVLLGSGRRLVLDADALTMFEGRPARLFDALEGNAVLTPHAGEFRRLFPDLHHRLRAGSTDSKITVTVAAARRSNSVVLFKGHDTVVATPEGQVHLIAATGDEAAPWLATAGSGDVLAGLISGLLARGERCCTAASTAAWLHSAAAREFGPALTADDLPDVLPAVLTQICKDAGCTPAVQPQLPLDDGFAMADR